MIQQIEVRIDCDGRPGDERCRGYLTFLAADGDLGFTTDQINGWLEEKGWAVRLRKPEGVSWNEELHYCAECSFLEERT